MTGWNPIDSMRYIEEQGDKGRQRGIAGLLGQAYAQPEQRAGLLGKVAMAGAPDVAMQAEQSFGKQADDRMERFVQKAGMAAMAWKAGNQQLAQSLYGSVVPDMPGLFPGFTPPPQMDDAAADAFAQIATMAKGDRSQVHSAFRGQNGNMWVLGRDGQVRDTGAAFDPNNQIIDTGNGYFGVNKTNLSAQPVMTGPPQAAPQQPAPPGPEIIGGQQVYIDPSLPPNVQAAIRANPEGFANAGEMQIPGIVVDGTPGGQLRSAPKPTEALQIAQFAAKQTRTLNPQEVAARGYRPGTIVQVDGYGNEKVTQAPAQDRQAMSEAQRKDILARKAKVPQLQNAIRGLDRIEKAIKALDGAMLNTGPMDAMVQRFTPKGQELEAAVGGIQNSILALTRVPGIGAQSDLEARIAMLQYPSIDKPPEVNKRTLENLKFFMRDLAKAYEGAIKQDAAAAPSPQPAKAPASDGVDDLLSKYGVR